MGAIRWIFITACWWLIGAGLTYADAHPFTAYLIGVASAAFVGAYLTIMAEVER